MAGNIPEDDTDLILLFFYSFFTLLRIFKYLPSSSLQEILNSRFGLIFDAS